MIIHPRKDVRISSPYSQKAYGKEESPEEQLLQRLVWVRFKSYWWPALIFQSYTELQEFLVDEMDTMMKAQMAMAIMRQMQERKNIKVARLLGKSTLEIVEVTTKYYDFYSKVPELLPKALNRSQYGRDTTNFLDFHRALDQVEVIISEVSDRPFSLMPGMGSTTWLQKAQEQLAKRDNLFDEGVCTFYPELRDQTRGDTSINPVVRELPMSHLIPPIPPMPVPSHIDQHPSQDYMLSQYHTLPGLAHEADDTQSVESMLSTGVVAPQRTATGKAVRFTDFRNNPKKHSAERQKSMPSIKEGRSEIRNGSKARSYLSKRVSESREGAPSTVRQKGDVARLRKIGRVKRPTVHQKTTEIRRPPMIIAKERNRIAKATESPGGMLQRVQEYLLNQQLSIESEKEEEEEESLPHSDGYPPTPIAAPASKDSSSSAASSSASTEDEEPPVKNKSRKTQTLTKKGGNKKRVEDISVATSKYTEASSESDESNEDHKTIANKSSRSRIRDLESVAISSASSGVFDDYLRETEHTLELLIKKERGRLKEEQRRNRCPSRKRNYGGKKCSFNERPGRGRNPGPVTRIHRPKRRGRNPSIQKGKQKEEPSGFIASCFPVNENPYELSAAQSYTTAGETTRSAYTTKTEKASEILPGLEGDDIVPGLSRKISRRMSNKEYLSRQYRGKKATVEILPGLEGDDIVPGLSDKVDKLVARKGFFTRHDVLKMIEELDQREDKSTADEEESISINRFDELARQRVSNLMR